MNQQYKRQLELEYIGLKSLYNYLEKEKMIQLTLEEFLMKCINDGIYDYKILDIMENDQKKLEEESSNQNSKLKNKWLAFVSQFSKDHNISYKEAMSSEEAKKEYRSLG